MGIISIFLIGVGIIVLIIAIPLYHLYKFEKEIAESQERGLDL